MMSQHTAPIPALRPALNGVWRPQKLSQSEWAVGRRPGRWQNRLTKGRLSAEGVCREGSSSDKRWLRPRPKPSAKIGCSPSPSQKEGPAHMLPLMFLRQSSSQNPSHRSSAGVQSMKRLWKKVFMRMLP